MSRQRIVEGVDERGRPRTRWADVPELAVPMFQPANPPGAIERRRATPEELEAVRARDAVARPLPRRGPSAVPLVSETARLNASRARGARRHIEVIAQRRAVTPPPEEEPVMADATLEPETTAPADDEEPAPRVALEEALERLASSATAAAGAWSDKVVAEQTWEAAEAALEDAWSTVGLGQRLDAGQRHLQALGELVETAERAIDLGVLVEASVALDGETQVAPVSEEPPPNIPRTIPEPPRETDGAEIPTPGVNEPPAADPPPADQSRLTTHQRRVLEATIRLQGDRKAVAEELHVMREGVDVVLEAVGKKGLLPAFIIPLLPARFAKYSTVRP